MWLSPFTRSVIMTSIFSCSIRDNAFVMFVLTISGVFWLHRLIKFIYNVCCYWEIRSFYINALKMTMVSQTFFFSFLYFVNTWSVIVPDLYVSFVFFQSELPYATWQEVQARIVEIQKEHQICIHKKELTELDIYHRILRFKNYMVCCLISLTSGWENHVHT